MIPAHKLIPSEALYRYDDDGEPLYSATERVLLAMRHHDCDWVDTSEIYDALGAPCRDSPGRDAFDKAISRLDEQGRVERRLLPYAQRGSMFSTRQIRLTRNQPAIVHRPAPVSTDEDEGQITAIRTPEDVKRAKQEYEALWRASRRARKAA